MPKKSVARLILWLPWIVAGCGARTELEIEPECDVPGATRECESICGLGVEICRDGHWQGCTAPRPFGTIPLPGTVRDFRQSHPDFEDAVADDRGIVAFELGPDDKPVYAGSPTTPTTHGQASFDQWYRDVEGVNLSTSHTILLSSSPEDPFLYLFDAAAFFPIDGLLFGNEGNPHNFHFTFELATEFRYLGGEIFTFTGDDDLWVFINRRLAIDLGGVHSAETQGVDLDAAALTLDIARGEIYPLALFFAERHTSQSTFHIETTISEFRACPSP